MEPHLIVIPLVIIGAIWGGLLAWSPARRRPRALLIPVRRAASLPAGGKPGPLSEPSGATGAGPAPRDALCPAPEAPLEPLPAPGAGYGDPRDLYDALRDAEGFEPGRFEGRAALEPVGYLAGLGAAFRYTLTTNLNRDPDDPYDPDLDQPFTLVRRVSYLDYKPADPELEQLFSDRDPVDGAGPRPVYPCEWCARHTPNGPQCGACNLMTCAECQKCPHQDDHDDQAYTRRATATELAAYRTPDDNWAAQMETEITGWHLDHSLTRMPWESTSFPAVQK